jgi:hypothetical protein
VEMGAVTDNDRPTKNVTIGESKLQDLTQPTVPFSVHVVHELHDLRALFAYSLFYALPIETEHHFLVEGGKTKDPPAAATGG